MKTVNVDSISFATLRLRMCFQEPENALSVATGFVYKRQDTHYLITNWHNVAGRNPTTKQCLSTTAAIPDILWTHLRDPAQPARVNRIKIGLYKDSEMQRPAWFEHPTHGNKVDVVAIPLVDDTSGKRYESFAINELDLDPQFEVIVADDAFVVGYPFNDAAHPQDLPIWKRASIATEPQLDIDRLPKLLIDTATRPGLSGSPVFMQRHGIHGMKASGFTGQEIFGRIRNFVGVYSGRIGEGELMAQLGVVWKARVIDEIIDGRALGAKPEGP